MESIVNIAAVCYSNTYPFVYGIENSGLVHSYRLQLVHPVGCAENFISGKADIALLPVGALNQLPAHNIITDLCIGASKEVKSVLLLSNKPLKDIRTIALDKESATSVRLCKLLATEFWNINPQWMNVLVENYNDFPQVDAFVVIGDKAFTLAPHFKYQYDLAEEWFKFTGLPFVFAVWVSRPQVNELFIANLNRALHYGVEHIADVVKYFSTQFNGNFDLNNYLTHCIDYRFDEKKKESLNNFQILVSNNNF